MRQYTVKQLVALTGFNQLQVNTLLHMAAKTGQARLIGPEERPKGSKGKPGYVWEVEDNLNFSMRG